MLSVNGEFAIFEDGSGCGRYLGVLIIANCLRRCRNRGTGDGKFLVQ